MFPPPRPWTPVSAVDPEREYVAFTSRFFLRSPVRAAAFMRHSRRIMKEIDSAPGAVGWAIATNLPRLEFFTVSAWESAEDLRRFLKAGAHGESAAKFASDMRRKSVFVQFKVRGRDLPLQWDEARARQVA